MFLRIINISNWHIDNILYSIELDPYLFIKKFRSLITFWKDWKIFLLDCNLYIILDSFLCLFIFWIFPMEFDLVGVNVQHNHLITFWVKEGQLNFIKRCFKNSIFVKQWAIVLVEQDGASSTFFKLKGSLVATPVLFIAAISF